MSSPRSARGRLLLFAVCVIVPATLLAFGWFAASVRDRRARASIETMRLRAVLDATERAIADGLSEILRREDERPFYLYSHYYVPPDLLTLGDVVAVSPLAEAVTDPRIIGWFQVDPDGTVRTPLRPEPSDEATGVEARLARIARDPALAQAREGIAHRESGSLVAHTMTRVGEAVPETRRTYVASRIAAPREALGNTSVEPLPVLMNLQANQLAFDIQRAQSTGAPVSQVAHSMPQSSLPQRVSVPIVTPRPPAPRRMQVARPPEPRRVPTVPAALTVVSTKMAWNATPDAFVLTRIVSHEGASVLQGVALDRAKLLSWMRDVARRASVEQPSPTVVTETTSCGMVKRSPRLPPGIGLCMTARIVARIHAEDLNARRRDVLRLTGLLSLVVLALVAVARLARKEAALAAERSDFVSAVSHELRTPITTLRMHAEMLEAGLVGPERQARVYEELSREAGRLSRLVENVLEASRLEAGRRVLRRERLDLGESVKKLTLELTSTAQAKGMRFDVVVDEGVIVHADPEAIDRVVANLLDNAIKYAADADTKSIDIAVTSRGPLAVLTVRDHGPGIPVSDREKVFERFHRVARDTDAHRPGTGLGLALVRELVVAHGGTVAVTAPQGQGTVLTVSIPASR